jgi:hypothetical protein
MVSIGNLWGRTTPVVVAAAVQQEKQTDRADLAEVVRDSYLAEHLRCRAQQTQAVAVAEDTTTPVVEAVAGVLAS